MGNVGIAICVILCLFSCTTKEKEADAFVEEEKNEVSALKNMSQEDLNVYILRCMQFELKNNAVLQDELNQTIHDYFERKTERFIDDEFGIISSYGHIFNAIFKSESKNKEQFYRLYQSYYKTTELHTLLRDRLAQHQRGVEKQRLDLLKGMENLRLQEPMKDISIELEAIEISSAAPIKRVEAELGDEVFSLLLDRVPLIISFILTILGLVFTRITKLLSLLITILSFGYMTYKGISYDIQVRKELTEQCDDYIKNNQIDILEQLNNETHAFYKSIKK